MINYKNEYDSVIICLHSQLTMVIIIIACLLCMSHPKSYEILLIMFPAGQGDESPPIIWFRSISRVARQHNALFCDSEILLCHI